MKIFLVLAVCVVAAYAMTADQKNRLKIHRGQCIAETKANEQLVIKLKSGEFKDENEALKKYAHCMLVKSELMTMDGRFRKEVALAKLFNEADKAVAEELIDTCLSQKEKNPYQRAWNYVKCTYEKDPKNAIFL